MLSLPLIAGVLSDLPSEQKSGLLWRIHHSPHKYPQAQSIWFISFLSFTCPGTNGAGMTFTSGSGNEVVCVAMHTLAKRIVGKSLADLTENMAQTWRTLVSGQIRWIGPEVLPFIPPFDGTDLTLGIERSRPFGDWSGCQCDMGLVGTI